MTTQTELLREALESALRWHNGDGWRDGGVEQRAAWEAQRKRLSDALAQPEQPAPQGEKLWLWQNFVDGRPEYLAFDNPYPTFMGSADPQTLGEPCGYAIFRPSRNARPDVPEERVLAAIARSATPPQAEQAGCACRWDKDDNRVQTCERHQGWLDVVHEWAERAKSAEQVNEADELLKNLGLDPERYRTEAGFINHLKVKAAIKYPDEYPQLEQAEAAKPETERAELIRELEEEAGYEHHWETIELLRKAAVFLSADSKDAGEPLFYYRPVGGDGLYEGPHHANSVGGKMLREQKPGEWKPLYTRPQAADAQPLTDADYILAHSSASSVGYVAGTSNWAAHVRGFLKHRTSAHGITGKDNAS